MSKNQENQNIVLGFIIGAAAGLAAGILLAPETGEETRRTIAKKATDLKGKANTLKGQVGSQINTLKGQVGSQINTLKEQVGSQINSTISKISDKTKEVSGQNGKKSPKKPAGQSNPNTDIVN